MWVDENRGGEGARALRVGESLNGRESRKDPSSSAGPGPGSVVGRDEMNDWVSQEGRKSTFCSCRRRMQRCQTIAGDAPSCGAPNWYCRWLRREQKVAERRRKQKH